MNSNNKLDQQDNPYKSTTSLQAPFSCDKCNRIFNSVQRLKEHTATAHQDIKHINF